MILVILLLILSPPLLAAMFHIFANITVEIVLTFEDWLEGRKPKNECKAFKEQKAKPGVYIKFIS